MTSPTDIPIPPQQPSGGPAGPPEAEEAAGPGLQLRRTLRSPGGESWEVTGAAGERLGAVTLHYGDDAVEGLLVLPAGTDPDAVRGVLAWITDLLVLDTAAGPGGLIHWIVSVGDIEDFWRRSPGRRATGAETDVATARSRVEQVLTAMFGEVATLPDGTYAVDAGSVRVFVAVRMVEGDVLVRVFSITNLDVPFDGDLPRFLLQTNFSTAVGRFAIDVAQRAVWFDHVVGADELDDMTLSRTIAAVAGTADRFDDEIKARFGGRTFREEGSPVAHAAVAAQSTMDGGYL